MKYNVLKRVIKKRFVILLIDLKNCKINECEKVEKEIKKLYVIIIVSRDKRENVIDCFDCEIIFVHNIDFRNVVNDIESEKINEKTAKKNEKKTKQTKYAFSYDDRVYNYAI